MTSVQRRLAKKAEQAISEGKDSLRKKDAELQSSLRKAEAERHKYLR